MTAPPKIAYYSIISSNFSMSVVLKEMEQVAKIFLRKSVTKSTLKTYDRYWDIWSRYITKKFRGLVRPTLGNVAYRTKVIIIIGYMATLYNYGFRGAKIWRIINAVKQSLVLQRISVVCFSDPSVLQSKKSCRYTTEEIKQEVIRRRDTTQLPANLDMIETLSQTLWVPDDWSKTACHEKAKYLAIALSYDTGRRMCHFTHRDKKNAEDHCIRLGYVRSSFIPCGIVAVGIEIRKYYVAMGYRHQNVATFELLFPTQKQRYVNNIATPVSAVIDRSSQKSSELVDMLVEWLLHSQCGNEDEFLTSSVGGSRRLLLPRSVRKELKEIAVKKGIDPKRIGNHSLRRGYATVMELNNTLDDSARARAGWCSGSNIPYQHYVMKLSNKGGLSHDVQVQTAVLQIKGNGKKI